MTKPNAPGELFSPGSGCPAADQLVLYLDGTVQVPPASGLEEHVRNCPHCQAELALFRTYQEAEPTVAEQSDLDWMLKRIHLPGKAPDPAPATPAGRRRDGGLLAWLYSFLTARPFGALAAVAALAILVIGLRGLGPAAPELQLPATGAPGTTVRGGDLRIESPAGDLDALRADLAWRPLQGARDYLVVITTVDGSVAAQVETGESSVPWPPEAQGLFRSGRPFFVQVFARGASGGRVAESERLRVVRKAGGNE